MELHGDDVVLRFPVFVVADSDLIHRRQMLHGVGAFALLGRQTTKGHVVGQGAVDRAHRAETLARVRLSEISWELVIVDDRPVNRVVVDGDSSVLLQVRHRLVEPRATLGRPAGKDQEKRDHRRVDDTRCHDGVTRLLWRRRSLLRGPR